MIDYLAHLTKAGRSGVTRARKLASIRECLKFLVEEKILPSSPALNIGMPKKEHKSRVFLPVVKCYKTSVSRCELSKVRPGANVLMSIVA